MTLKQHIAELIAEEGPISVARYMELSLGHPSHGYYMTRDPFGSAGDFTTAPEISQMFGELLGLWAAQAWADMGRPAAKLIEIGPGRGTLMADALRAIGRALPQMLAEVDVVMVETSPVLRDVQQRRLAGGAVRVRWVERIDAALDGAAMIPVIILANELLDALPVHQFVMTPQGWRERLVGLDAEGRLAFGVARDASPEKLNGADVAHPVGTVLEVAAASDQLIGKIATHLARLGGVALFIDYGSAASGVGDTLQAVSRHAFADPLNNPGEADLTTHVDFARAGRVARAAGARAWGVLDQADLLERLGIGQRAAMLSEKASPEQAAAIAAGAARLTDRSSGGMGALFKALAISHPDHAAPAFEPDPAFDSPSGPSQ